MLYQEGASGGHSHGVTSHNNNNDEQELHALFKEIQKANAAPRTISASLFFVVCTLLVLVAAGFIFTVSLFLFFTEPCSKPGQEQNPYASLANFCSHVNVISANEYAQRRLNLIAKLQQVAAQLGDANAPSCVVMEPGASMSYFTAVSWGKSERAFLFIMARNGQMAFITPAFERGTAMEKIKFTNNNSSSSEKSLSILTWQENESPYALVKKFLQDNNLPLQLAVDQEIRNFIVDGITAQQVQVMTGASTSGNSFIRPLRMIKSENEIKIMDCANRATKAALSALYKGNVFRVGATEAVISEQLLLALKTAGLTNIWMLVLGGSNAAFPHGTSRLHTLVDGDFLLIDTGGELFGYQSDISRTFLIQSPSKTATVSSNGATSVDTTTGIRNETRIRAWDLVRAAQDAALQAIKPGVSTCAQVAEAGRKVITDAGYGPMYTYFTHRLGHGIGLQGHEDPYMVESNTDTVLREGMTFSIEPGIYVPNDFGVRIEDIVQVTSTGYKVFGNLAKSIEQPVE